MDGSFSFYIQTPAYLVLCIGECRCDSDEAELLSETEFLWMYRLR